MLGFLCSSLWGKFAQRSNLKKVTYSDDPAAFFELLSNDGVVVNRIDSIGEDMVRIEHVNDVDYIDDQTTVNVVIAVYTTSYARLELYKYLDILQERVLYFDTDSVFFVSPENEVDEPVKTGDGLGDLTDELPPGKTIVSFVTAGPKNYSYKLSDGTAKVTVKGVTMNSRNKGIVTYELIKSMVFENGPESVCLVNPTSFSRDPLAGVLSIGPSTKTYRKVYSKRMVMDDKVNTKPYGYKY